MLNGFLAEMQFLYKTQIATEKPQDKYTPEN